MTTNNGPKTPSSQHQIEQLRKQMEPMKPSAPSPSGPKPDNGANQRNAARDAEIKRQLGVLKTTKEQTQLTRQFNREPER